MFEINSNAPAAVHEALGRLDLPPNDLAGVASDELVAVVEPIPAVGPSHDPRVAARQAREAAVRRRYRVRVRTAGTEHEDLLARVSEVGISEAEGLRLTSLVERHKSG